MSALDILEAAAGHMKDRAATYDKPAGERSMGATVAAFKAITGISMTEEQGWLFMGVLKQVRTQQGGWRADNYEDGAAYFALQGEAAERDRGGRVAAYDNPQCRCVTEVIHAEPSTEDMTDPRNWRAGDWVERTTDGILWTKGNLYRIGTDGMIADDGGARCKVLAHNWRFHARPDADGWIKWEGGECPVKEGSLVDVLHKDGEEYVGVEVGKAAARHWSPNMGIGTIIAYRPHLATKHDKG